MAEVVTFTTATGSRVTCDKDLARRLGYQEPSKDEKPTRSRKSSK